MKRLCKICGNIIIGTGKIYCSNKCKFSDSDYNKNRCIKTVSNNKNILIECTICYWQSSDINNLSGVLTKHCKNIHNIRYLPEYFVVVDNIPIIPKFKCPLCNWQTIDLDNKSGWFTTHLKKIHNLTPEVFTQQFPEYEKLWKIYFKKKHKEEFLINNPARRKVCLICGKYFYRLNHTHLKEHGISREEYRKKYNLIQTPEVECSVEKVIPQEIIYSNIKCLICNAPMLSDRHLSFHVRIQHNIDKVSYIKQYIYNNSIPLCECGCGNNVKIKSWFPYINRFISGHGSIGKNNSMYGKTFTDTTRNIMSTKAMERFCRNTIHKNTLPEKIFKTFLDTENIKYKSQHITEYGIIDFYLQDLDLYVEIDGNYWHPEKIQNLNFQLLSNIISEYKKNKIEKKLVRIYASNISKIKNIEDIYHHKRKKIDFNINYYQPIISREYFRHYIENNKRDRLEKYIWLLRKFVKTLHPKFPFLPQNEILEVINNKIKTYSFDKILIDNNTFNNNCSSIGINYLKSNFKSYWNSRYKGNVSPIEAWYDNKILSDIIKYRIGINNSGEIFDFSLHQIIRGMSAKRITISFFKPILAAAIYKHFLGNNPFPIVIDPCAGFGGRLLGFKSMYPNGTYIGIEPNIETYNELYELGKNFTNIKLYNMKIEDFIYNGDYDLVFTSIPYFDKEIYSNNIKYDSFEHWKKTFIERIKKFDKLVINLPTEFESIFDYKQKFFIRSNTSHFNKQKNKKMDILLSNV